MNTKSEAVETKEDLRRYREVRNDAIHTIRYPSEADMLICHALGVALSTAARPKPNAARHLVCGAGCKYGGVGIWSNATNWSLWQDLLLYSEFFLSSFSIGLPSFKA